MRMHKGVTLAAAALALALVVPAPAQAQPSTITGAMFTPIAWNLTSVTWVTSAQGDKYEVFVAGVRVATIDDNRPLITVDVPLLLGPADVVEVQATSTDGVVGPKVPAAYWKGNFVFFPALLHYAAGSTSLNADAQQTVGKLVKAYLAHGFTEVKARGHGAGPAGASGAKALAWQRADHALALIRASVPVITTTQSWGNALPIASNDTEQGRWMNRRVALLVR